MLPRMLAATAAADEHPLAGSQLSPFTQAAAPLLAGAVRLWVVAAADPQREPEAAEQLAGVLERVPHIQVGSSAAKGNLSPSAFSLLYRPS